MLPLYILDDAGAGEWAPGAASRCYLERALGELQKSLKQRLRLYSGDAREILPRLAERHRASALHFGRCYEPWQAARDAEVRRRLEAAGVAVHQHPGDLLWEPEQALRDDGGHYRVFTPFYRRQRECTPPVPLPAPKRLNLLPVQPDEPPPDIAFPRERPWMRRVMRHWRVGERAAQEQLQRFAERGLADYDIGRDYPQRNCVSRLSPHLHFGEISPRQIWHLTQDDALPAGRKNGVPSGVQPAATQRNARNGARIREQSDAYRRQLGWRDFAHHLLHHNPRMPDTNLQPRFDAFPWRDDAETLEHWQRGETGIPIVDAGMRELWETGYMHNRVRMLAASLLCKNLLVDWRHGARWFWDCLVDADLANNSMGWQWVAGCGVDAAPYFRIFNPVTQGGRFDPDGQYTRRFVPELADIPDRHIHAPWQAKQPVLNYPEPIVDLHASREQALTIFRSLKRS